MVYAGAVFDIPAASDINDGAATGVILGVALGVTVGGVNDGPLVGRIDPVFGRLFQVVGQ